jgi:hypothetical protein
MITSKSLGIDQETGLEKKIIIHTLEINSQTEVITVKYQVALVSPTGKIMAVLENGQYTRFNSPIKQKYNALRDSAIGQGIIQMLGLDLDLYPNINQTE